MLERVVYFSGPSGNGKTTLIRSLMERNPLFIPGNPEKFNREEHLRNKLRKSLSYSEYLKEKIQSRVNQAIYHANLERMYPKSVILGDRCIHDSTSYIKAGVKLGLQTQEEVDEILSYQERMHPKELMPKNVIFFDFPLETLLNYLKERWKREGVGERENERYLKVDIEEFREHFSKLKGYLHLTDKRDENLSLVEEWISGVIQS